jgi:hypothetical protein
LNQQNKGDCPNRQSPVFFGIAGQIAIFPGLACKKTEICRPERHFTVFGLQ